ncbi:MAG TPA: YihY/virulence factor BrkB family protein [Gemmatimonadaceae bacterium]|nr:YihY/virulence factor BrkB family protein [Gemmatimonadaceae bacterium]
MIIKGYRVGPLLKKTGKEVLDDNILGLAAQTAYYFFFSLFPLFLFVAPLLSVVGRKQQVFDWIMGQLAQVVPAEALSVVSGVLRDVVFTQNAPGLISTGALLAAWAGSNVFGALIDALNRAYDVEDDRPWWKKRLIALASVAVSGIFMGVASTVMLAGPEIADWLERYTPLGPTFKTVWLVLQYPLALALLVAMFWLIYYFLPNLRQKKSQALVGALVGALLWVLATLLFRAYVTNFADYNKTYGTIGGVIILLTWMYYTMVVILVGGELNSELHHGTGAIEPRRGAVYEGRIVTTTEPGVASNARVVRAKPLRARGA